MSAKVADLKKRARKLEQPLPLAESAFNKLGNAFPNICELDDAEVKAIVGVWINKETYHENYHWDNLTVRGCLIGLLISYIFSNDFYKDLFFRFATETIMNGLIDGWEAVDAFTQKTGDTHILKQYVPFLMQKLGTSDLTGTQVRHYLNALENIQKTIATQLVMSAVRGEQPLSINSIKSLLSSHPTHTKIQGLLKSMQIQEDIKLTLQLYERKDLEVLLMIMTWACFKNKMKMADVCLYLAYAYCKQNRDDVIDIKNTIDERMKRYVAAFNAAFNTGSSSIKAEFKENAKMYLLALNSAPHQAGGRATRSRSQRFQVKARDKK